MVGAEPKGALAPVCDGDELGASGVLLVCCAAVLPAGDAAVATPLTCAWTLAAALPAATPAPWVLLLLLMSLPELPAAPEPETAAGVTRPVCVTRSAGRACAAGSAADDRSWNSAGWLMPACRALA